MKAIIVLMFCCLKWSLNVLDAQIYWLNSWGQNHCCETFDGTTYKRWVPSLISDYITKPTKASFGQRLTKCNGLPFGGKLRFDVLEWIGYFNNQFYVDKVSKAQYPMSIGLCVGYCRDSYASLMLKSCCSMVLGYCSIFLKIGSICCANLLRRFSH